MSEPEELDNSERPEEENSNYTVSERALTTVDELLQKDHEDASLQRYKALLLGNAIYGDLGDALDHRRIVVEEFKVVFEDNRQEIIYHLDTPEGLRYTRETPFSMDEGARYRLVVRFRVNHNIVTGLRFQNNVRKYSLSLKDEIVLGSYAPQSNTHEFVFPRHDWTDAPSGMVYRGKYNAECKFIDSDNFEHLRFQYGFDIKKV